MGREPGNSISGSILVFKSFLELSEEIISGSKSDGGTGDGILLEGISPSQGRSFSHV